MGADDRAGLTAWWAEHQDDWLRQPDRRPHYVGELLTLRLPVAARYVVEYLDRTLASRQRYASFDDSRWGKPEWRDAPGAGDETRSRVLDLPGWEFDTESGHDGTAPFESGVPATVTVEPVSDGFCLVHLEWPKPLLDLMDDGPRLQLMADRLLERYGGAASDAGALPRNADHLVRRGAPRAERRETRLWRTLLSECYSKWSRNEIVSVPQWLAANVERVVGHRVDPRTIRRWSNKRYTFDQWRRDNPP